MKRLVILCTVLLFIGCASLPGEFLKLDNHKVLGLDSVMHEIAGERVIFIGEIHGTASIHLLQLEIIKRLLQGGKGLVIAIESFPFTKQAILNRWIEGSIDREGFKQAYRASWSIPFEYYQDIFDFAKKHHVPIVAMNAEDELIRGVLKRGLQAVQEDFLRKIKFTDCSTDTEYREFVSTVQHVSEFPFFCDGQRLRDSVMAFYIASAMRGNDATVVVLAGIAHSYKLAVPRMLERLNGAGYRVLLPEEVKYFTKSRPDKNIADYIWF